MNAFPALLVELLLAELEAALGSLGLTSVFTFGAAGLAGVLARLLEEAVVLTTGRGVVVEVEGELAGLVKKDIRLGWDSFPFSSGFVLGAIVLSLCPLLEVSRLERS